MRGGTTLWQTDQPKTPDGEANPRAVTGERMDPPKDET